jgi:predicted alpha/beta superfamily hydrolase
VVNEEMELPHILILLLLFTAIDGRSTDNSCEKAQGFVPCMNDGNPGFCWEGECLLAFEPTPQAFFIKMRYPQENKHAQNSAEDVSKMHLRGSGLGLSWEKGKMMTKSEEKDTWELRLEFKIPGYEIPSDMKPSARLEFRVYLNDKQDMLGPNFVLTLPLSTNAKNASKIPEFWVYPWFFSKKGKLIQRRIYSQQLGSTRDVLAMLPPSFEENTYKHYETMIMNDGQRLNQTLPQLNTLMVERALIKEIILVGIPNDFKNRTLLLAVSNGSEIVCVNNGTLENRCNGCIRCNHTTCGYQTQIDDYRRCYKWVKIPNSKVYGQLYLDFIQDTVIPECISEYRSLAGPENFGMMGFSLGGLMTCHAIWTRPQTFGSAACMSPSLWWPFPANATFPDDAGFEFTTTTLMKFRGTRPRQKIYIDVGSNEGYIMISPAKNASVILDSTPYFELNKNLWFYIWKDEYHSFMESIQRMWVPLIAFYGTEGSPTSEIIKKVEMKTNTATKDSGAFLFIVWMYLLVTFLQ